MRQTQANRSVAENAFTMHHRTIRGTPLCILALLFALVLLPWQGQAADLMPVTATAQDCHAHAAAPTGHCADTTQHAADSHGHAACCQAPTLCPTISTAPALGITSPRIAGTPVHYSSFVPPILAPPPRC